MRLRKKHYAIPEMQASPHAITSMEEKDLEWHDYFTAPDQPLSIELGTGRGRFLVEMATKHPERNYLGIDIEANAAILAKRAIHDRALKNTLLLIHDITRLEGIFPKNFCDQLFIHFPNPWPKKRHFKRRLTHPRQLVQYHTFLKDDAKLYFKTDDPSLYEATMAYLPRFGFAIDFHTEDLTVEQNFHGIITEYEEKWRGQGIKIKAIQATKNNVSPQELEERLKVFLEEEKSYTRRD